MQVTDIEEMRSKEQEVEVKQAMEHLVQEREAENQGVMTNSGKHIDEASDRQKRRSWPSSKNRQPKHCGLRRLEVESIITKTSNDGHELVIPLGSQQGNHPSIEPATSTAPTDRNCHSNVMQTLHLLERFGVSDEFYEVTQVRLIMLLGTELCIYCCFHLCLQVYPELARSYQVKQARQEKGKDIELEWVPAPFHGVYHHFKPAVVAALQREVLLILLLVIVLGTHSHTQILTCNL